MQVWNYRSYLKKMSLVFRLKFWFCSILCCWSYSDTKRAIEVNLDKKSEVKPRRRFTINSDDLPAAFVITPAPIAMSCIHLDLVSTTEKEVMWCGQHAASIYHCRAPWRGEFTPVLPPKNRILIKNGAIIISRNKWWHLTLIYTQKNLN